MASKTKGKTVSERIDHMYGRYRIIAGFMQEQYHAYAYTGSRVIHKAIGSDPDQTMQELKDFLHKHMQELLDRRDEDGVPCAEEYREAIESVKDKVLKEQILILKSHAEKPGDTITIKDLMRDAECETLEEADMLYAKVGRIISIFMDFKPGSSDLPFKLDPICTIAIPKRERSGGLWEWEFRPQFVEALQIAKL